MILSNKFISGSQDFSTFENRIPVPLQATAKPHNPWAFIMVLSMMMN